MHSSDGGCGPVGLVALSVTTLVILALGTVSPLLGGSDMNGLPLILGSVMALVVWVLGLAMAQRERQWGWSVGILSLTPVLPLLYGMFIAGDIGYPEAWDQWAEPPWYLLVLFVSPLPTLLYCLTRWRRDGWGL